jgi:hypothetical protein
LATGPESQHQRQRHPPRHRHRYRFAVPDYQPIFELESCHSISSLSKETASEDKSSHLVCQILSIFRCSHFDIYQI